MTTLLSSLRSTLRGIRRALGTRAVHKAYLLIMAGVLGLSLALYGLGFWAALHFLPIEANASWYAILGLWLLRAIAFLLVLVLSPLLAINAANLLFPVFSEVPFFAGMRHANPDLEQELRQGTGLKTRYAIFLSLRRLALTLLLLGLVLPLGFIPVAGPPLVALLQGFIAARAVGWEMLDPYFDRRGYRLAEQKTIVRSELALILGHGLPIMLVLSVPIVGPLCFAILQASTAQVVADHLEKLTLPSAPEAGRHEPKTLSEPDGVERRSGDSQSPP